eukprot:GHVR01142726.1.p1 GENE.GHVR01142726.1~~GHVR01142726.1.p1  ORF type:complete len:212 (+),score=45.27 GHVR01142726.1:89-724(+)
MHPWVLYGAYCYLVIFLFASTRPNNHINALTFNSTEFNVKTSTQTLIWDIPISPPRKLLRYTPPADMIVTAVAAEVQYDQWVTSWGRDFGARQTSVEVQDGNFVIGAGVGLVDREFELYMGWGKSILSYSLDESDLEGGLAYSLGKYGVRVDKDLDDIATGVEVVARGVELGVVIDRRDRDYGARVKIRNFELSLRHDYFDILDPLTAIYK